MSRKPGKNKTCERFSVFGETEDGHLWTVSRANCKKWDCPVCGEKNAARFREAIFRVSVEKGLTRLLTLTLDPSKFEGDSVAFINKCWVKLRVYLSRRDGARISFIRILELQGNGRAHFHILLNQFLPFEWIRDSWKAVGGGSVDIRHVTIQKVSGYLGKYLTKDRLLRLPSGKRRFSTSKDIKLFSKMDTPEPWGFSKSSIEDLHCLAAARGTVAESKTDKEGRLLSFVTKDLLA